MPGADVDYLDDAMLAIGESVLEVTVCPGVSRLSVRVEVADERFVVDIAGRGDVIEYDEGDGLFEMLLEGLVDNRDIRRGDQEYRVHLVLNAPVDVA